MLSEPARPERDDAAVGRAVVVLDLLGREALGYIRRPSTPTRTEQTDQFESVGGCHPGMQPGGLGLDYRGYRRRYTGNGNRLRRRSDNANRHSACDDQYR